MSNKIVVICLEPQIYRAIIDDVIAAIEPEFTAHGVEKNHLEELQALWEKKVVESHVADFDNPPQPPPTAPQRHYPHHYPSHVLENPQHHPHAMHPAYASYVPPPPPPHSTQVKAEPLDARYTLATGIPYAIPALPGPQRPGMPMPTGAYAMPMPPGAVPRPYPPLQHSATASPANNQSQNRIPQVDGPSSSASESPSPPPSQAPRASHPSLPQPPQAPNIKGSGDSEEINSDLDDSDTDGDEEDQEGAVGEVDTVLCTYDKVARVKNKWKCVLKDGMIHVNNKDYLFAKCTCEFEW